MTASRINTKTPLPTPRFAVLIICPPILTRMSLIIVWNNPPKAPQSFSMLVSIIAKVFSFRLSKKMKELCREILLKSRILPSASLCFVQPARLPLDDG